MSLAFEAMMFAREVHKDQRRKYTNNPYNPYTDHLAEVAGIVASIGSDAILGAPYGVWTETVQAVAWLHDCVEDQGVSLDDIGDRFGGYVQYGVRMLSDLEEGSRAERKLASRRRLAYANGWVQTIKCADLISNTASIAQHDPKFAATYLEEKRLLLDAMTKADPRLLALARAQSKGTPND